MSVEKFARVEKKQDAYKDLLENLDLMKESEQKDIEKDFDLAVKEAAGLFESLDVEDQEKLIEEYANHLEKIEGRKPSRMEVFLRVIQYFSPERKLKTDQMVRDFLLDEKNNFKTAGLKNNRELAKFSNILKTIYREGFGGHIVIALKHFSEDGSKKENLKSTLEEYSDFLNYRSNRIRTSEKKWDFATKEKILREKSFPSAVEYLDNLKKSDFEKYRELVTSISVSLRLLDALNSRMSIWLDVPNNEKKRPNDEGIDCNEQAVMLQEVTGNLGLPVYLYSLVPGHAALQYPGAPIILDTYDGKLRTQEGFMAREGYYSNADDSDTRLERSRFETRRNRPELDDGKELAQLFNDAAIDHRESESLIRLALTLDESNDFLHYRLALILAKSEGRIAEAIIHFERSFELEQKNTVILLKLGMIFEKRGEIERAIASYEKFLRLDKNKDTRMVVVARLIKLLHMEGKKKEIHQVVDSYLERGGEYGGIIRTHQESLRETGLFDEAKNLLMNYLSVDDLKIERLHEVSRELIFLAQKMGLIDISVFVEDFYKEVFRKKPTVVVGLELISRSKPDSEEGLSVAKEILKLDPKNQQAMSFVKKYEKSEK